MTCFLDSECRLAQRAAWSLSWAARTKPEIVYPHIQELVSVLSKKDVHDAVIRNSVRILQEVTIPEKFHGEVMDACFRFLERPFTPIAIKAISLTILYNLSKVYPEIKSELKLLIADNWENETPAFWARANRILPKL